jgi:hypothetical protein
VRRSAAVITGEAGFATVTVRASFADFGDACVDTALSAFPTDFVATATGLLAASA